MGKIQEKNQDLIIKQLDANIKTIKICSIMWFLVIPMIIVFIEGIILTIRSSLDLETKDQRKSYYLIIGIISIITGGIWWIVLIVISVMGKSLDKGGQ